MSEQFKQGHALIIGVGADLPNTVDDAVGLTNILKDRERCAYPLPQVQLLTAETATRQHILAGLDQLAQVGEDATVIVYFSGHGYEVTSTFGKATYLMPYGYDVNQLFATAVSGQELTAKLEAIPAQKLLLLLDCCHAGGLDPTKGPAGMNMTKVPLPPEATTLLAQGSGRAVIASSQADELSYAGKPYSAFTLALIEALAGQGVSQQDGTVRLADLALHTRQMVPQRTKDRQHPILNFTQADNFVVAYYAGGEQAPKELPFTAEPEIEPEPGAFKRQATTSYYAKAGRGGTIVQGTGNTVVGAGGVNVGGNVGGSIVTGDDNIITGDVSGQGIGIGRGASGTSTQGVTGAELGQLFAPLLDAAQQAPPQQQEAAVETVVALQEEVAKGEEADDGRMANLIEGLVQLVPAAVTAVVSTFASPILAGVAGPVTKYVLDKLQGS
jgi:hypothetical protein